MLVQPTASDRGLDQGILVQLPVYKFKSHSKEPEKEQKKELTAAEAVTPEKTPEEGDSSMQSCAICMDDYKEEEDIMILPCLHQVSEPLR